MSSAAKAYIALLITVLLWSYQAIAAKNAVADIPSMVLLFLRMLFAAIAFLPFFIREAPWKQEKFPTVLKISLFACINTTAFLWGIGYTSASASQLIYAAMPISVMVIERIVRRTRYPFHTMAGVGLGFVGIGYIGYLSLIERGTTITGGIAGNIAILIAMTGWVVYIFKSKKLSTSFSPFALGSTSVLVNLLVAAVLAAGQMVFFQPVIHWSGAGLWGAAYMGIFGTFLAYIFYQYGIRHSSPLTVSMTSYVQPVTTGILAMIFLNERLTIGYVVGCLLIFSGIFLSSTMELIVKRRRT